jgi:4-oxalocrotonate tautomerase
MNDNTGTRSGTPKILPHLSQQERSPPHHFFSAVVLMAAALMKDPADAPAKNAKSIENMSCICEDVLIMPEGVTSNTPREEIILPIIQVHLLQGRSVEAKRKFAREATEAACRCLDVNAEQVRIIFSEMARDDYAISGVLVADRDKNAKP